MSHVLSEAIWIVQWKWKYLWKCVLDASEIVKCREKERGKEMKISEIDGCFIHFVIKEAPQNCENVCRK